MRSESSAVARLLAPVPLAAAGAIGAAGAGTDALFAAVLAAEALARPVTRYATAALATTRAALVPERTWAALDAHWPAHPRELQLALAAATEALSVSPVRASAGLFLGTSLGSTPRWESWHARHVRADVAPMPRGVGYGDTAPALAAALGLRGPVATVSTACTSAAAALVAAADAIRLGELDQCLVVGVDLLGPLVHAGFDALHALSPDDRSPRPFAHDRAGLWLGEGAAAVVLDRTAPRPRAWYLGGATSGDGTHMTAPDRQGRGMVRAARRALAEGGAAPSDVAWVSAHATATRFNDAMEAAALHALFDGALPPVHGAKPVLGHTLGASGLLEVVLCVEALERGVRPPTHMPAAPDPDLPAIPLDARPEALRRAPVLSLNAAFAGHNTAVLLGPP